MKVTCYSLYYLDNSVKKLNEGAAVDWDDLLLRYDLAQNSYKFPQCNGIFGGSIWFKYRLKHFKWAMNASWKFRHEPLNWPGQLTRSKILKTPFFKDISNSFHRVTRYGLKPLQFFSFENISTNTVARGIQSFGQNGPWLAGQLSNGHNFCKKSTQTCAC